MIGIPAVAITAGHNLSSWGGLCRGMDIEHETDQFLIFALVHHQWNERYLQSSFSAIYGHRTADNGFLRQRLVSNLLILFDILIRHREVFRIGDIYGVNTIRIVIIQRKRCIKEGQRLPYPDFLGSQVKKLLLSAHHRAAHQKQKVYYDTSERNHFALNSSTLRSSRYPSR